MLKSIFNLAPLTLAGMLIALPLAAQISVTSYGAVPDGSTDNTAAINKAFAYATAHRGTRIVFPCTTGNSYRITSPITFPSFTTIEGDNQLACSIMYSPLSDPGPVHAAFNLVGSAFVHIRDLSLLTQSTYPPQTIIELGGAPGGAGQHTIENVQVSGFASQAMGYSIGSENNNWRNVYWSYLGGGASFGFYTSALDDLGICPSCQVGSNLSLYFSNNIFVVGGNSPFVAIADKIGGGTGDHYYQDGYIGLNRSLESVGLEFISGAASQGGPNENVRVSSIRIENGGYGLYFKKDYQQSIFHLDIQDLTWCSYVGLPSYFAYADTGLTLSHFRMAHNTGEQAAPTAPSSFDSIVASSVDETYGPITIHSSATDNTFTMHGGASIILPSNASGNTIWENGRWQTH